MVDVVYATNGSLDGRRIGDAALDQVHPLLEGFEVGALAGAEIVQDADLMPRAEKAVDEVGANEPCPAGDQTHGHNACPRAHNGSP